MSRPTHFDLTISINTLEGKRYLINPDGDLTDNEAESVVFWIRSQRNGMDAINIDRRTMELADRLEAIDPADKLKPWIDLNRGIDAFGRSVQHGIESKLWPAGRPEATGDEAKAQNDAYSSAWGSLTPDDGVLFYDRERWRELIRQRSWLRFLAEWYVMLESVEIGGQPLPTADIVTWRSLESTQACGDFGGYILDAYEQATTEARKKKSV